MMDMGDTNCICWWGFMWYQYPRNNNRHVIPIVRDRYIRQRRFFCVCPTDSDLLWSARWFSLVTPDLSSCKLCNYGTMAYLHDSPESRVLKTPQTVKECLPFAIGIALRQSTPWHSLHRGLVIHPVDSWHPALAVQGQLGSLEAKKMAKNQWFWLGKCWRICASGQFPKQNFGGRSLQLPFTRNSVPGFSRRPQSLIINKPHPPVGAFFHAFPIYLGLSETCLKLGNPQNVDSLVNIFLKWPYLGTLLWLKFPTFGLQAG